MFKLNKKLVTSLSSIFGVISLGSLITIPLAVKNNNSINKSFTNSNVLNGNEAENIENNNLSSSNANQVKPLVPLVSNFENAKLVTKQGPIVFWGDTIKSLDWFGAERWSVNLTELKKNNQPIVNNLGHPIFPSSNYKTDIQRSWVNWEIDRVRNKIWILSNVAAPKNGNWNNDDRNDTTADYKHQYLVSLDTQNGKVIDVLRSIRVNGQNDVYRNISIFYDGTPIIYGLGFSINRFWHGNESDTNNAESSFLIEKYDTNTKKMIEIGSRDVGLKFKKFGQENNDAMDYMFNVIPISENRNLFFTIRRANIRSSTNAIFNNDKPFEKSTAPIDYNKRDMSITCVLLDDNLKQIPGSSKWSDGSLVKIIDRGSDSFKNKYTFAQRDWYTLLDGRVVTILYDNLVIFDPSNKDNPTYTTYKIGEKDGDWVESYTFDTDENIFYKLYGSSEIRKITLDKTKGNNHIKSLYYDLKNSSDAIKKHANSFTVYNVFGYSGQIMILNSYFDGYNSSRPLPENDDTKQYGLAAAITNHKSSVGQGDTKGLLNTDKAFQKSADFTLSQDILNKKLPSEITRNDITLLNNSFFTNRTDINTSTGSLLYEPFVKKEIDDINKTLKVVVNIDQIPWFVTNNVMPKDIAPLTIEKTFTSTIDIKSRFTWKNSDIEDYDFKNTLPSKITIDDIKRISPLVSTLISQNVTFNGSKYPKVDYKIKETDDSTGKIKIEVDYNYFPMDVKLRQENIKVYKLEKEYRIFKNTDTAKFKFIGDGKNNINEIPELKDLKESNLFPSQFNNANKQEFLRFININETAGYPLEKMEISVEANDSNGTLKVNVNPTNYDSKLPIQTITYNGLNKLNNYSFNFIENPTDTSFKKINYRPSDITDELLFKHFINYSGFDSSDLESEIIPNNENGSMLVNVSLSSNYPSDVLEKLGFVRINGIYKISKNISGFKTNKLFNEEYQLLYKDDLDASLIKIKELTPATIQAKLKESTGLTVNGKTYNDEYSLVKEFIKSKGIKIPEVEKNDKIEVQMFVNNSGGELTWKITFKSLDGYPNPLTFIQKFTGFAKGNDVITDDILTFKDSNQLKITKPDYLLKKPSEIKKMLEDDKSKIVDFLSGSPTGAYANAITNKKFTLEVSVDDNFGTLTISIKFNRADITNNQSLLEYSQTFEGFQHF